MTDLPEWQKTDWLRYQVWQREEKGKAKMTDAQRGLVTVVTLTAALLLSRVGVITLIEKGYSLLSYGFILFFLIPTLFVGGYKIITYKGDK